MNTSTQNKQTRRKIDTFKFISPGQGFSKEILIEEEEIIGQLFKTGSDKKFLGILTEKEIYVLLRKCKVLNRLHEQGFKNTCVEIETENPFSHTLRICRDGITSERVLVELVIQKTSNPSGNLLKDIAVRPKLEMLFVDWLLLQNPTKKVKEDYLLLPGQHFPGLGLAREMLELIKLFNQKCCLNGLIAVPGHYHNAVIFSELFQYLNPTSQGRLNALKRDLVGYPLSMVSWAVELNCVKSAKTDEDLKWFVDWQVLATNNSLDDYFKSKLYNKLKEEAYFKNQYVLNIEKYNAQKSNITELAEVII